MTEEINVEFQNEAVLSGVLNKLKDSNFISIFFLLMEEMSPAKYLCVIKQNKNQKENCLRKLLQFKPKDLITDLLWTIKRYDLLKSFNVCRHSYQYNSSLNMLWKSLYEACCSIDTEQDLKYLKETFKVSISDEYPLEVFIVKAYKDKLISKTDLEVFLTNFNKDNEHYSVKTPTVTPTGHLRPCGLAIIINHEDFNGDLNGITLRKRKNSPLDVDALINLWKSFGFEIRTCIDYTAEQIHSMFENLAKQDLSSYDVFIACYMSHGSEGIVYSSDCVAIKISCLIDCMANKCKTLANKPKLFFIQACQGSQIQCGNVSSIISKQCSPILSVPPQPNSNLVEYSSNIPILADVLVASSSIPGFTSFAPEGIGKNCWFIEGLVTSFKQHGDKMSILDVLVKVNEHVSKKIGTTRIQEQEVNCKQTVEQKSTLRKILKLKKLHT